MFEIKYADTVAEDLKSLSAKKRATILDKIEEQLRHEPNKVTRNKKMLVDLSPPWPHEEPVWELRIGEYRAFYDVDESGQVVNLRALRRKPPHKTTKDIL
jgi:mRNA-degrading endonuclease RelE of RelBE toxin-antitoxin system